jgi:Amino acid synthesis
MTATFDIRKIVTLRDVTYSELGHKPARPIVRAVGMAVIHNPGKYAEDLRQLWEAGAELGERLTPELVKMLGVTRGVTTPRFQVLAPFNPYWPLLISAVAPFGSG